MTTYYSNWKSEKYSCDTCDWSGTGADLAKGDTFSDLFEVDCPKCHAGIDVITYPTLKESRENWDKVDPVDKMVVELAELRAKNADLQINSENDQEP